MKVNRGKLRRHYAAARAGADQRVSAGHFEEFWSLAMGPMLAALRSGPTGLTSSQAVAALAEAGENRLESQREASAWRLLGRQFASPIEIILVAATVLSGLVGDWTDAMIILAILVLSGALGFIQEHNAGSAMRALLASVEVTAVVLRDGVAVTVPIRVVVPGDVVQVDAGDVVPGDCRVINSAGLTVDESALTGEAFPVEKRPGIVAASSTMTTRSNAVFFGTHVASGSGRLLVVRTGRATEIAAVAARIGAQPPPTGFERGMTAFGLLLTRLMVIFVIAIFVINLLLQRAVVDSVLFSLALAVGLTPQLLPAIVSISLAQGARMMASRRVIVRRLDAIEDFGSMTVLCSDKTGTMTAGEIELNRATTVEGESSTRVANLASLNAGLQQGWRNPIDDAILTAHPLPANARALAELPYDFDRKRLSVLVQSDAPGEALLITKGALSAVLEVCDDAVTAAGLTPLDDCIDDIHRRFASLSAEGFRVLGVATRSMAPQDQIASSDEAHLTLVGLLTFADPVKTDAATTLEQLAAIGVSVRMITGDNQLIAAHIARQIGLDLTNAYTGADIDALTDAELALKVDAARVFSELTPVQKERIVRSLRATGHVVGYLGDGINDAPPLHAADVGITVNTAVPVAKSSAAIVLLDKDLGVILEGVRQGRRTFANTMKYIFMTISANFGNMLSMAAVSIVLPFLPLLAGQILLINLLTDVPATAIATDTVDARQLRRPQRWNLRLIRNYMIVFGALSSFFDLTTFAILRWGFHAEAAEFRSAWFLGSVLTEVAVLFVLRTREPFYRSKPSRWVVITSIGVALAAIAIPFSPLAALLELVAVPIELLAVIFLITLGYVGATELMKRVFWARSSPGRRMITDGA